MASAAKAYGIPMAELKRAKRAGCTAFRGSRVFGRDLIAWLQDNPGDESSDELETLKKEQLRRIIRRLDLEYEQAMSVLIPKQTAMTAWSTASERIQQVLERVLDRETFNIVIRDIQSALRTAALQPH